MGTENTSKLTARQWIGVVCVWLSGIMLGVSFMMSIYDQKED